jgi:probable rRNA maturation factor
MPAPCTKCTADIAPVPAPDEGDGAADPPNRLPEPVVDVMIDAGVTVPIEPAAFRTGIMHLLPHVAKSFAAVSVRVVDDRTMSALHARHVSDPSTTDVLTFDLTDEGDRRVTVDIVVCADEAGRRAAEIGHAVERELLLYVLHGLLHVTGFDDRTPAAHDAIHAEEDRILRAAGIGAIYAPDGPRDGGAAP